MLAFGVLYGLFIYLIKSDKDTYRFIQCQVHVFFNFIIILSLGRLINSCCEALIKYVDHLNNKQQDPAKLQRLEYFNISTECVFNLFILYYFISIGKKKETIERHGTIADNIYGS